MSNVYTFPHLRHAVNHHGCGTLQGLTPLAQVESIDGTWGLF
jgi:hypothetical protein